MSAEQSNPGLWQVWVETGGTFTDCVAVSPNGEVRRAKVLSSSALRGTIAKAMGADRYRIRANWRAPSGFINGGEVTLLPASTSPLTSVTISEFDAETLTITLDRPVQLPIGSAFEIRLPYEAPVLAARLVTQTSPGEPLPPVAMRVATTRGTNALLTRRGTPPAFFVTAGFADLLVIGTQQRPDLFALDIVKPTQLTGHIVEVHERLNADGSVLRSLDETSVANAAHRLVAEGVRTAAISLMHSYRNPEHELRVAAILRDAGFTHVSVSSELAPFIKHLPRAQTAVVNAYLAPIMDSYLSSIVAELPGPAAGSTLQVMTSAGGLVRHTDFRPKDSLLSGPAGGVVGALHAGRAAGFEKIIAFDMGGTSTDVARCDGAFDYVWEHTVGDAHLVAPALAIESVAAGGGSICRFDSHGLHVGPESAGADPGPACYGAGGPLTLTDVNLLLGRVDANAFEIPIDRASAESAADALIADMDRVASFPADRDAVLRGLLEIANERMADAIRRISLRRGYDPADYALVAFGGAGDQHACAVADKLGITTVIVPPDASLLSARGLGSASIERFAERQMMRQLDAGATAQLSSVMSDLETRAISAVASEGVSISAVQVRRRLLTMRLLGQESGLEIEYAAPDLKLIADLFSSQYAANYGFSPATGRGVEIVAARVIAGTVVMPFDYRPTVGTSSIIADPGWTLHVDASAATVLTPVARNAESDAPAPENVRNALFSARFAAIADEMGEALRRTALSANVKERLDYSCAVLDSEGSLVAAAAHIPVHLGALGACVRSVKAALSMAPGDVAVTNHPAFGGSHLPDVTVITPVFCRERTVVGYVASRAHHAEIGGSRPGSMPPNATTLAQEGVVIPPMYLMQGGDLRIDSVCELLAGARYPSRAIAENRADLLAAVAANARGASDLEKLTRRFGLETVRAQMANIQDHSERLLRAALIERSRLRTWATERLDDGSPISVRLWMKDGILQIDFTDSAATHPGNLNATPAIVRSAVIYVLRLLINENIPLNEGILRPVRLILPQNSILDPPFDLRDPEKCPAVVGGNTETSQRIVDTLVCAFGLLSSGQGTMNNTIYGNEEFGYYETVCGGAGATANTAGASAVHTHMTNTRITDAEIVESRYPVRVERFAIRPESGGIGEHRGGDGVIRETVFLAPLQLSVLTQHRVETPYGLNGGGAGRCGRQRVFRANGEVVELSSVDGCEVGPGDRLVMKTPGGGGWGWD